ncbi:zinc ribbon domain-containing protein [bacterium]|nr:zinc ribbon domain-containing protein [bacterium]
MPIYEYQCSECGHTMEALRKMSDPPLTECPACHRQSLQKQVSAAGFRLKGDGWYQTDFKNKGKPDSSSGSSSADG